MIKQPNLWSCGLAATAMLLNRDLDYLIQKFGHDGSEIIDPSVPEPRNRRAFSVQEITDVCLAEGVGLVQIDAAAYYIESRAIFPDNEARLTAHMTGNPGLITGWYAPDRLHMVAWDGQRVYDPMDERRYSFNDSGIPKIAVDQFFLAVGGIKSLFGLRK